MKKIIPLILGLAALMLITSASPKKQSAKKSFEKIVFLELTVDQDSMLFKPYSKAWDENWQWDADIVSNGTEFMNYEKYSTAFKDRMDNLWTIVHPLIINGEVQVYYPYSPQSYGSGPWDEGELRHPVMDKERSEIFVNSEKIREELCYVLGRYGPMSDFPIVDEYGDPILVVGEDGTQMYTYPPPEYYWYEDEDIIKYKLRVRIEVNKNGKEKKRVIEACSPVVNRIDELGNVLDEMDAFWLDFEELKPTLKEAYFLNANWKPVSYWDYISEKVKNADFRKAEP